MSLDRCTNCDAFVDSDIDGDAYTPCGCLCKSCREGYVICVCGGWVHQYDATAGGADSDYGSGAACEFDYPVTVECENCGRKWCDGSPVDSKEWI